MLVRVWKRVAQRLLRPHDHRRLVGGDLHIFVTYCVTYAERSAKVMANAGSGTGCASAVVDLNCGIKLCPLTTDRA